MAGLIKKGVNFTWAYAKWVIAGKPLRDDKYIFELYDTHCSGCDFFIPHKKKKNQGECDSCGCHIKRISAEEDDLNKLAWPTEGCPEEFWDADIGEPEETTNTSAGQ